MRPIKQGAEDDETPIQHETLPSSAPLQPSLESLIATARNRLPEQGVRLSTAQSLLQSRHVDVQAGHPLHHGQTHARCMDAIIEAWRSSLDSYCGIFNELSKNLTNESLVNGRQEEKSRERYKSIIEAARRAQDLVMEHHPAVKQEPHSPSASTSSSSDAEEKLSHTLPTRPAPTATGVSAESARCTGNNGHLNSMQSQKSDKIKQKRDKHTKRLKKLKQQKQTGVQSNGTAPPQPTTQTNEVPNVDFEDASAVSAEVQARLQARRDAKKKRRAEKKRKRESGDSFASVDGEEASHDIERSHLEKPSKKKARKSGPDDEVGAGSTMSGAAGTDTNGPSGTGEKRKDAEAVVEGSKKKRQKKNKG